MAKVMSAGRRVGQSLNVTSVVHITLLFTIFCALCCKLE